MYSVDERRKELRKTLENFIAKIEMWQEFLRKLNPTVAERLGRKAESIKMNYLIPLRQKEEEGLRIEDPIAYAEKTVSDITQITDSWATLFSQFMPETQKSLVEVDFASNPIGITSSYLLGSQYVVPHTMASLFIRLFIYNNVRKRLNPPLPVLRPLDKSIYLGMILFDQLSTFKRYYEPVSREVTVIRDSLGKDVPIYTFSKGPFIESASLSKMQPPVFWTPVGATSGGVGKTLDNAEEVDLGLVIDNIRNIIDSFKRISQWKFKDEFSHLFFGAGGTGKTLLLFSNQLFGAHYIKPKDKRNYRTHLVWVAADFSKYPMAQMRYDVLLLLAFFDYLQSKKVSYADKATVDIVRDISRDARYLLAMLPLVDKLVAEGYGTLDPSDNAVVWDKPYEGKLATTLVGFMNLDTTKIQALLSSLNKDEHAIKILRTEISKDIVSSIGDFITSIFDAFPFSLRTKAMNRYIRGIQIIVTLPISLDEKTVQDLQRRIGEELRKNGVGDIRIAVTGLFFVELPPAMYVRISFPASTMWKQLAVQLGILKFEGTSLLTGPNYNSFISYTKNVIEAVSRIEKASSNLKLKNYAAVIKDAWIRFLDVLSKKEQLDELKLEFEG